MANLTSYIMVLTLSLSCLLTNINAQAAPSTPQDPFEQGFQYCTQAQVSSNDPWAAILAEALSTLGKSIALRGPLYSSYAMLTYERDGPAVHAMYQCRPDLTHDQCLSCVLGRSKLGICNLGYGGGSQNDACAIKFSSNDFRNESYHNLFMYSQCDDKAPQDIQANPSTYSSDVQNLINILVQKAPGSKYFFNTSQKTVDGLTLYGAAQCDKYLSEEECHSCLSGIREAWKPRCGVTLGAQIFAYSCSYRFATHEFILQNL